MGTQGAGFCWSQSREAMLGGQDGSLGWGVMVGYVQAKMVEARFQDGRTDGRTWATGDGAKRMGKIAS